MAKSLTFEYDKVGDILNVSIDGARPYPEQESDYLGDEDVVVSFNPTTGEVERLEILFFNARMQKDSLLELDLSPDTGIASADKPHAKSKVSAD